MKIKDILIVLVFSLILILNMIAETSEWVKKARIVGGIISYDMEKTEIKERIDRYAKQGVSVLLIWTASSDNHYFTDNDREFLKDVSSYIHNKYKEMKVIVYIGPLEEQSYDVDMDEDGKVDPGKKSIYTEHPEWLQVGIDGRPAVFYGDIAFWIEPTSEDTWLCPNDPEIRKIWYDKIIKLAKTGIDGVWWDVPFFIHYFGDNWDGNWTCHCNDCQNSFKKFSGKLIPNEENWQNPLWRRYIDWRFASMANFIKECKKRAKRVSPDFVIINETWDPNNVFLPQVGFSPYYMRITNSNDGIAHEFGSQDPQNYHFYSWLLDTVQGIVYRGVDLDRASWILSYSHNKEHAKTRCASVLFSGSNFFEVGFPEMAGTIDPELRTKLFHWIKDNEKYYYGEKLKALSNVAVFYSFPSLKYYGLTSENNPDELLGTTMLLLKNRIPFKIITDDRVNEIFEYKTIFFPSVFSISDSEVKTIKEFVSKGGTIVISGAPALYNERGAKREKFAFEEICGAFPKNVREIKESVYNKGKCILTPFYYGIDFYKGSSPTNPENEINYEIMERAEQFFQKILNRLENKNFIKINEGIEDLIFYPVISDDYLILRVNNLKGLKSGNFTPVSQNNIVLTIKFPKGIKPIRAEQIELLEKAKPLRFTINKQSIVINFDIKRHKLLIFKISRGKKIKPVR